MVYRGHELHETADDLQVQWPNHLSVEQGFGYWVWKPLILMHALRRIPYGEVALYVDAGCHLHTSSASRARLIDYRDIAHTQDVFLMHLHGFPEVEWTKASTFDELPLKPAQRSESQRLATAFAVRNSARGREFLLEWFRLMSRNEFALVRDDAMLPHEYSLGLKQHRHDQSVLSVLSKRWGIASIPDETYHFPDWQLTGNAFPIWALRYASGTSPFPETVSEKPGHVYHLARTRIEHNWAKITAR